MRVLCYGGSFNPIHNGHLIVARAVAEAAGFDRVRLIPSAQPPHKPGLPDLAPALDRLTMCQSAVQDVAGFEVSDIELQRSEPSYTLETVRQLRANGTNPVFWLIGADTVPQLIRWHKPAELSQEVQFVVAKRPNCDIDWLTIDPLFRHLETQIVPAPLIDISATDIRRRVAAGLSIDFLTPSAVIRHIQERRLYQR